MGEMVYQEEEWQNEKGERGGGEKGVCLHHAWSRQRVFALCKSPIQKDGLSALAKSCMCKKHRVCALVSHIRSYENFIMLYFFHVA